MQNTFQNPILPGFYPDPSTCRVDDDYYLVTSSFEYFPGLPIFHSRDLVHWRQIGHALDRPSQLNLDGVRPSGGLYAPTLRYHQGTFYIVNTLIDSPAPGAHNFIITAAHPEGPWSDPVFLKGATGIDPSLFFDDDGRAWYCGNRPPLEGQAFTGEQEIWLQELDLKQMQLTGPQYSLWRGALKGAVYTEAPHIYKVKGNYYLLVAEGGTEHNHAVTIARSPVITGPYTGNPRNPILTHRHLGLNYPIVGSGHADLVQTRQGDWWMVCLAMRPYGGYHFNLGRETFLTPVTWEESLSGWWPVVNPGMGRLEFEQAAPNLPVHSWEKPSQRDNFSSSRLDFCWNFLRTPRSTFYSLKKRPGFLRLKLRPETLMEWSNPSFIGRRQQHIHFRAQTRMEFNPQSANECAGLVLLQNDRFQFRLTLTLNADQHPTVQIIRRSEGVDTLVAEKAIPIGRVDLRVEAHEQAYSFYVHSETGHWECLASNLDGRILSTITAGGFVGTYMGLYASSNGLPACEHYADFEWFDYEPL